MVMLFLMHSCISIGRNDEKKRNTKTTLKVGEKYTLHQINGAILCDWISIVMHFEMDPSYKPKKDEITKIFVFLYEISMEKWIFFGCFDFTIFLIWQRKNTLSSITFRFEAENVNQKSFCKSIWKIEIRKRVKNIKKRKKWLIQTQQSAGDHFIKSLLYVCTEYSNGFWQSSMDLCFSHCMCGDVDNSATTLYKESNEIFCRFRLFFRLKSFIWFILCLYLSSFYFIYLKNILLFTISFIYSKDFRTTHSFISVQMKNKTKFVYHSLYFGNHWYL